MDIGFTKLAQKELARINEPSKGRLMNAIYKLPKGNIKRLQGNSEDYRLRVGDYRVIYSKIDNFILINEVLPRGSAYK
jgi:mRNA interferase RelE/StbE